jgi:hypothetical protein
MVQRGGDVGSEVLGKVGVGLDGGQGGLQVLIGICIWHDIDFWGAEEIGRKNAP